MKWQGHALAMGFVVVLVALLTAGCDGESNGLGEGSADGVLHSSEVLTLNATEEPLASAFIQAATGGTVTVEPPHPLAGTAITIPPGALAQSTLISISSAPLPIIPGAIGPAVEIMPDGTVLATPATVTIAYDDNDLPVGTAEATLSITRVEPNGSVTPLVNVTVDPIGNTVSGSTLSLAVFVVEDTTSMNHPPVADAGPRSQTVQGLVTLGGGRSRDVDGDPLTYHWSFVSTPPDGATTFSDPTAIVTTFTPTALGTYIVALIVNDGTVNSTPDMILVVVEQDLGSVP